MLGLKSWDPAEPQGQGWGPISPDPLVQSTFAGASRHGTSIPSVRKKSDDGSGADLVLLVGSGGR
jgi:hypothetical protein